MQKLATRVFCLLLLTSAPFLRAQPLPLTGNKDTVIAIFEGGGQMAEGEFQALIPVLSEIWRTMAENDYRKFLRVYNVFLKGNAAFQSHTPEEKAKYKPGFEFAQLAAATQYYVDEHTAAIPVTQEEIEKYYDGHKDPYREIKLSGLKVAFGKSAPDAASSSNASRTNPVLTEEEAKAKALRIVAEVRAGADFSQVEQREDDDSGLKAKGGQLGAWKMTDNVPDLFRSNILSLKQGEVSEPVRQNDGFYVVHADAVIFRPLAEVREEILAQLRHDKGQAWLQNFRENTHVQFPDRKDPVPQAEPSGSKKQ